MSKIVALDIKAVKRITAAHIEPDGSMVVIGGDNTQGKSSVLDAIAYAIGGKGLMPSEPLRRGEEKGHAEVTLDDGVIIRRTFTSKGGTLKITTAEGLSPSSAQTWLNDRIGALSFDPSAFLRERPAAQAATLRRLCGVDTTDMDDERRKLYEDRTEIGRQGKIASGAAEAATRFDDAPAAEVVLADIIQERRECDRAVSAQQETVSRAERFRGSASHQRGVAQTAARSAEDRATAMDAEAAEMVETAKRIRADAAENEKASQSAVDQFEKDAEKAEKDAAAQLAELPDIEDIDERIGSAEETNRQVRANAEHARLSAERDDLRGQYSALTGQIEAIDTKRSKLLEGAEFPLDGLAIDGDGVVTYNDLPLDQASQAEQIRISLGVGAALSPDLRIVLIREGSLLDAAGLKMVADEAERSGTQVWIERVGDADDGVIVIDDGGVRGS